MNSTRASNAEDNRSGLEELESILAGLRAGLRQPGLAGQRQLHARLEDLQAALLGIGHSHTPQADQRQRTATLLAECRHHLQQTDGVLAHLRQWVQQRTAEGGGDQGYGDAVGRGRPGSARAEHSRGGALETTIA